MEAIKRLWVEAMEIREARWFLAIVGLGVFLTIGYYFITLFRNMAVGENPDSASYIAGFQQLRDEGKLDDEEYAQLSQAIPKPELPTSRDETEKNQ